MKFDPKIHHRRSIRLKGYDYSLAGAYFVTIVAWQREMLFGEIINEEMELNELGQIVSEKWKWLGTQYEYVELGIWVVMPNHFHGILIIERRDTARCVPTRVNENRMFGEMQPGSLSAIIRSFKSAVTKRINELRNMLGKEVWQKGFYEHIIRNENDLYNIRKYIELNPLQWEIDEYYSGSDRS